MTDTEVDCEFKKNLKSWSVDEEVGRDKVTGILKANRRIESIF